jgi:outer membrane protein OmpA-like peptidoglycan-associated protein
MRPRFQYWLAALATIAVVGLPAAADSPGVTDLSGADASVIEVSDIASALGVPRGTRIEPTAPPTIRLPIYFEFNSANLRPDAEELLAKVGAALTTSGLEPFAFSIEGHTDSVGGEEYNGDLSHRRAETARDFLIAHGVDSTRLEFVGRGETSPVADNESDAGRRRNRRVEVVNLGMP